MCAGRLSRAVSPERGPLVPSSLPIWLMNFPSGVKCRIWSPSLLPPTQTVPSLSTCRPCSFCHPLVAVTRAAPVAQQIAVDVELHDGRCRLAAFGLGRVLLRSLLVVHQRRGAMENPDVAVRGGRDPGHLTENPVFRERLRPERLGLERRRCFCLCGLLSRSGGGQARQSRERNCHCRENTPHRRLPVFAGGFIRR